MTTRSHARHTVLTLSGELDVTNLDDLCDHLRAACRTRGDRIVLDLSRLTFIDSSGLSVLVEYDAAVRGTGGALSLVAPRPQVSKVLSVTGLNRRLTVHERLEDAVT
ncbi:STAS domain-containing protein [Spirillospora sp. NPDC029432]|uniref:STAS domain-containing protein n=1 Tax=Spirillospora sp. NPDC029432 TaxID=3154599 RepID=UPI003455538A